MPTASKAPKKTAPVKMTRIVNLHEYRRFRLELPNGNVQVKNGQDIPQVDIWWIIGQRDVDKELKLVNYIELNPDQMTAFRANKGLMNMVEENLLNIITT